jgi:hypothetical protein
VILREVKSYLVCCDFCWAGGEVETFATVQAVHRMHSFLDRNGPGVALYLDPKDLPEGWRYFSWTVRENWN